MYFFYKFDQCQGTNKPMGSIVIVQRLDRSSIHFPNYIVLKKKKVTPTEGVCKQNNYKR
jgi:hypothetical protein